VTAELAVAMPAVSVVLAAVLSVAQVVLGQVACVDAARAGARAAARGDDLSAARALALRAVSPSQSGGSRAHDAAVQVGVVAAGDVVTVTVSRPLRLLAVGPTVRLSARAVAAREQPAAVTGTP
jgi:hypothetical protein